METVVLKVDMRMMVVIKSDKVKKRILRERYTMLVVEARVLSGTYTDEGGDGGDEGRQWWW